MAESWDKDLAVLACSVPPSPLCISGSTISGKQYLEQKQEYSLGANCSVVGPRIVFPSGSAWLLCLAASYMSQCLAGEYRSHLLHRALEILIIEVTKV